MFFTTTLRRFTPLLACLMLLPSLPAMVKTASAAQLEEVIVTARKREESLQRTPVSITALTAATIEQAALFDIKDIEALTPNLNFIVGADGSISTLQAFIRGIGQFDFAVTTDPGVGVYIDGVYLARSVGANLEFSDVERISVLRGPQGTLFGKNTIGGAINVVTRAPSGGTSHSAEINAGAYGYWSLDGYVEYPLGDNLAGSLSALWRQSDGWQKRDRGDNAGNDDMYGLRGHLTYDLDEFWSSHLVMDYVDQQQNVYPRVLADFNPTPAPDRIFPFYYNTYVLPTGESCCTSNIDDIDRSHALNELERDELNTYGVSWTNTWDFEGLNLKSITGYRDMEAEMYRDSDNSTLNYFSVDTAFDTTQFSQELLLTGTNGPLEWLAGLYYFDEDADHYSGVTIAEGLYGALAALPDDVTITPGGQTPLSFLAVPLDLTLDYRRNQKTTSYAAFLSATWHTSERTRVNAAVRYTRDEKELDTFTIKRTSQTPIAAPGPTGPDECSDVTASGKGSVFSCEADWDEVSPKIGIDHDFSDTVMGYAHISRGFRSGVFNGRPTTTAEISVANPETVTAYEVGFKSQLLNQTLQINGAAFHNDYDDQQFLINQSTAQAGAAALLLLVDNAAESTLKGVEVEFTWLPTEEFTIAGSASWLEPQYEEWEQVDFVNGGVQDLSNRVFRDVPEYTASLLAQYETELEGGGNLRLRGDMSYRHDIHYTNDDTAPGFEQLSAGSFTIWNAGVTYTTPDGAWEFGLYCRNLSDKREIVGGFEVAAFGTVDVAFNEPRRYFASIKYTGQ